MQQYRAFPSCADCWAGDKSVLTRPVPPQHSTEETRDENESRDNGIVRDDYFRLHECGYLLSICYLVLHSRRKHSFAIKKHILSFRHSKQRAEDESARRRRHTNKPKISPLQIKIGAKTSATEQKHFSSLFVRDVYHSTPPLASAPAFQSPVVSAEPPSKGVLKSPAPSLEASGTSTSGCLQRTLVWPTTVLVSTAGHDGEIGRLTLATVLALDFGIVAWFRTIFGEVAHYNTASVDTQSVRSSVTIHSSQLRQVTVAGLRGWSQSFEIWPS